MLRISALICFLVCLCRANKLPDYFNPCYAKDQNLGKCIGEHVKEVLPILIKGDKVLNFSPLSPFPIELNAPPGKTFKFSLKGGKVEGLEGIEYRESKFNLEKVEPSAVIYFPKLAITGPYEIDGKFLNKPVKGRGLATITLSDVSLPFTWSFKPYKKNGIDYLELVKPTGTCMIGQSSYSFAQDNKEQAAELTKQVNEQSKTFTDDISIALSLTQSVGDLSAMRGRKFTSGYRPGVASRRSRCEPMTIEVVDLTNFWQRQIARLQWRVAVVTRIQFNTAGPSYA